ncbi:class I SAM-dependent methyltransferase [Brevibacillus ginsengisoli]|uniref:class I SAM-dependent methyltransferase n=1 Tax=Brevibacillus ginsengisoli TaxID=363854 RepID=UPI003CF2A629
MIIFLKRFVSNPTQVGSIIPSSRFLSSLMMKPISWERSGVIVELGPGTGVFTQEIMKKMKTDSHFFVIERDPLFQKLLRKRFPTLIIRNEAVQLSSYLSETHLTKCDAIISGLPFAVFPEETRRELLDEIEHSLNDEGVFVTFQYSLQLKEALEKRFAKVEISFTLLNFPPAFVYTCYKK